MAKLEATTGYFKNGLPYASFGNGAYKLVIFNALDFKHEPPSGPFLRMVVGAFGCFTDRYTVYLVNRKRGLPNGYSIGDMSEDYATTIRDELGGPVDIMGMSLGGSIAQHFAVDYPNLVRRLVIASCAYRGSDEGDKVAMRLRELVLAHKWRAASATLGDCMFANQAKRYLFRLLMWIFPMLYSPTGPSDGVIEIEAVPNYEYDFKERLAEIKVPTLVVGGDQDIFYPATLLRETAAGIPNARLILYEGLGHGAMFTKQLARDVLAFLTEDTK